MDVVFLDANVLYSAAHKEGSRLARLWELADVEPVSSAYAVEEVRRNPVGEDRNRRLDELLRSVRIVPEVSDVGKAAAALVGEVDLPHDDLPILMSAIMARASHLLTGDFRDFGRLYERRVRGVFILPPVEYLRTRSG